METQNYFSAAEEKFGDMKEFSCFGNESSKFPKQRGNSGFGNFVPHSRNNPVFGHVQKITELLLIPRSQF